MTRRNPKLMVRAKSAPPAEPARQFELLPCAHCGEPWHGYYRCVAESTTLEPPDFERAAPDDIPF